MDDKTAHRVIIVGAGPAGLTAAIALNQQSTSGTPIHVTILELRDAIQTLGGAVNLTPLALKYLDSLGVGERLRPLGHAVSAIEMLANRTGSCTARLWPGVDALRVLRQSLAETMMETVKTLPPGQVDVQFGVKIQTIEEFGAAEGNGGVRVTYTKTGAAHEAVLEGDVIVGCDGLHSQVRATVVDPSRKKSYSGKCVAYGYADVTAEEARTWTRNDGQPLITDSSMVMHDGHALLMSYFQPARDKLFLAAVMPIKETGDSREGWAVHGADKAGLKRRVADTFAGGKTAALGNIIDKCDDWFFFPVWALPGGGVWSKGRALLIGDAAHAMPPQGESTGVAIEDSVLLAHVFSRRTSRSVPELLADYERLRRAVIDDVYKETLARWNAPVPPSWMPGVVMDWFTWAYVFYLNRRQDHFGRDVRKLALPE